MGTDPSLPVTLHHRPITASHHTPQTHHCQSPYTTDPSLPVTLHHRPITASHPTPQTHHCQSPYTTDPSLPVILPLEVINSQILRDAKTHLGKIHFGNQS